MNQLDTAESWINKAISELEESEDNRTLNFKYHLSTVLNNLSGIQMKKKEFEKSKANLIRSLELIREISVINPQRHNPGLVSALLNSSMLYLQIGDFKRADQYAAEAEGIVKELVKKFPMAYNVYQARALDLRSMIQLKLSKYEKSELIQMEAVAIQREMASVNPMAHGQGLAYFLVNLAAIQEALKKPEPAIGNLLEALDIILELEALDSITYKYDAGVILGNLARLYFLNNEYQKAEACMTGSLKKYQEIAHGNLQYFMEDILEAHKGLIQLYYKMSNPDKIIEHSSAIVSLYSELAQMDPPRYYPQLGDALSALTMEQYKTDLPQAIADMNRAIGIFRQCTDSGFAFPPYRLSVCYTRMARYQIMNRKFDEAEKYARKAIKIYKSDKLYKNLAHALLFNGKYHEAEKIYRRLKDKVYDSEVPTYYKTVFIQDLEEFEKFGITHPDVEKIREKLAE